MPQNAKNKDYTIIAEVLFEDGSYSETKTLTVSECSVKEYLPSLSVSIEPQKTSGYEQKIIKSNINNRILIFLIFGNIVLLLAIIYVTQLIFSRR